jgi:SAM-dependent methyltransferase
MDMKKPLLKLKSPGNEQYSLAVPAGVARLGQPFNGSICSADGSEFVIENNIIRVLGKAPSDISLAQTTNNWSLTAGAYEDLWRKRSIGILSGDDYSLENEAGLLNDWLKPREGEMFLDVGCSTAFYARSIVAREPGSSVVAIDFALPMLEEARERCIREDANVYLIRADAREMPFYAGTFDGIVSGGTLNELNEPLRVLYECRRVLKKGGRFFIMYLLKSESWLGALLQKGSGLGGIRFWTEAESDEMFAQAGFTVSRRETRGIVCFTLLEPRP